MSQTASVPVTDGTPLIAGTANPLGSPLRVELELRRGGELRHPMQVTLLGRGGGGGDPGDVDDSADRPLRLLIGLLIPHPHG